LVQPRKLPAHLDLREEKRPREKEAIFSWLPEKIISLRFGRLAHVKMVSCKK